MGDLEINGNGKKDPEGGDQVDVTDEVEEEYAQEYAALDSTLDQLNDCLNALESKNDDLFGKLQALLEDSREARKELLATPETPCNSNCEISSQNERVEKLTISDGSQETSKEHASQEAERDENKDDENDLCSQ